MYINQAKDRAALPGQTAPRTELGDGFPNQAACPREGLQTVLISQDDIKKVGPLEVPSPSSPQRLAELLHLNLSGLQLEGLRCAPTFFGIMPRRLRCQHQSPAVNELVIKCTKKPVSRGCAHVRLREGCKVKSITSCVSLVL